MLKLKAILLWIAFVFLTIEFVFPLSLSYYFVFRILPIASLLLWFIISLISKNNYHLNGHLVHSRNIWIIKYVRPLASILIVLGASFKLLKWNYSDLLLIVGIGCMAIFHTFLSKIAIIKSEYNPDIIDDESLNEDDL
jgi:hypothetical protein